MTDLLPDVGVRAIKASLFDGHATLNYDGPGCLGEYHRQVSRFELLRMWFAPLPKN